MKEAILLQEWVAITVWWFANTSCYKLVSNQFGIAWSTVAGMVVEVCQAMELECLSRTVCLGRVKIPSTYCVRTSGSADPHLTKEMARRRLSLVG